MKQQFKILALFLGVILSKSLGGAYCEDSYYCTEYKLGVGAQWGVHNSKAIDDLNVLGSIFVDANIWNKWLYFALKSHFGLGKAWITNIEKQDSKKDAIYDDISVRFALGLPLNVVFSHAPSIAMSEPILLYLTLSVGINDYGYSANMPSQKRNAIGLGLAGSGIINDYWKLEYALEYGYIYNGTYKFSHQTLGTKESVRIGSNSHDLRLSLGLVQNTESGFYMRLSGIYRSLDVASDNSFFYPQSTQAIGMFELGASFGNLGL